MLVALCSTLLVGIFAKSLPSNINRCRLSDPNLNKCLDINVADGVQKLVGGNKDLGVVPLEPLHIEKIEVGSPNGNAPISIHQEYTNMKIYGMAGGPIYGTDANFSATNCYWRFKSSTPKATMQADYKMTGQLLIFPIGGHGKCTTVLYDVEGDYDGKCEKYSKKGKTHLRVTSLNFKTHPKNVSYDFQNIIEGNAQLSKEVSKTINENGLTVYADVGPAFDEALSRVWKDTINRVFARVPEDELFLP